MSDETNTPEVKPKEWHELTPEEIEMLYNEVRSYRHLAGQTSCRPIKLPDTLTIPEYNWMVNYLTGQRRLILNSNPKIPKSIKDKDGNTTVSIATN